MMRDSNGDPIRIRTDPGLVCSACGFDNTPGPVDTAPEHCEGCGADL